MLKVRKKKGSRITAVLLALMMAVVFMPTFAFAADGEDEGEGTAADPIKVFMTVSDQGVIAKTNDGDAMAWKEVTVTDLDKSGDFTYDEALKAAHEAYNSAEGLEINSGGWVTKLWGVDNNAASYSYFQNGKRTDVTTITKISKGDYLVASVNRDALLYADWAAEFNTYEKSVVKGESFDLTIKGFPAMTINEPVPGTNLQIGTWKDGAFTELDGVVTDENGTAELCFEEPGTYIVTAEGSVTDVVDAGDDDNGLWKLVKSGTTEAGKIVYGKMDWSTYETFYAYTEKDYEDGPYPFEEIQYVDSTDYDDADDFVDSIDGYPVYSGSVSTRCPLIAPCCIVNVMPAVDVTMTVNNKGEFASTKDGEPMVEKEVTAADINGDGAITYDEALVAAHEEYCEAGADGFAQADAGWVTKLWGIETGNTLFCVDNESISPSYAKQKAIEDGDALYASVNADNTYYADYMSFFDETDVDAETGEEVTLNIQGFLGMGYGDQLIPAPLEGLQIGYWYNGEFVPIDGAVTDEKGTATFTPDEDGDYLLTAKGTVHTTVYDWTAKTDVETDAPIMAPYCFLHVEKGEGEAAPINAIKKNAINELLKDYDPANYRTNEQIEVMSMLIVTQVKILEAKNSDEVKAVVAAAKGALDAVTTDAQYKAQEDAVKAVKVAGVKAKAGKKKITVSWKKNTTDFDGYQVSYAMKGKKAKTVNIAKNTVAKKVIKKLKKGKKYTVKVRGYKTIGGAKTYGAWSAAKKVKVK